MLLQCFDIIGGHKRCIYHLYVKYLGFVYTDDPLCGESIGMVVGAVGSGDDPLCGVSAESIGVVKGEGDTWVMRLLQSI